VPGIGCAGTNLFGTCCGMIDCSDLVILASGQRQRYGHGLTNIFSIS
jgi:hypothetical protein